MAASLASRIKKIKAFVMDVDGVLTDGKIVFDSDGKETKVFDVQDGFGVVLLKRAGFKTAILTARASAVVTHRGEDLKIDRVYQDAYPKIGAYKNMLTEFKLNDENICFMGDDLPDLQVLKRVGLAVAVSNAALELKKIAHYITKKKGGDGAIREVIELILKTQGKWKKILSDFS